MAARADDSALQSLLPPRRLVAMGIGEAGWMGVGLFFALRRRPYLRPGAHRGVGLRNHRWAPLVRTGEIALGLYLLHGPASWVARSVIGWLIGLPIDGHSPLSIPITFVSAFIAASLSWHYFESPINSLKDRFTRTG